MKCSKCIKMKMYLFRVSFISESIFFLCENQFLKNLLLSFHLNQNKQVQITCIRARKMINKSSESVDFLKNNLNFLNAETKSLIIIATSYLEMLFSFV